MSTPPWLSADLPRGSWHADVAFIMRAYEDLEDLADILHPKPLRDALDPVVVDRCDCGSVDGGDQSDSEEVEDAYCPTQSSLRPDSNRTFFILEQVLPRLNYAAQKLDDVISNVAKRAEESRDRWTRRIQAQSNCYLRMALRLEHMPSEIIFSIASMASQQDRRVPFTLSRVNTTLRQLILSMPLLWANLDAADFTSDTMIRIQRSQDVPLKLHMLIPPDFPEYKLTSFIRLLEPERRRVQRISIVHFDTPEIMDSLKTLLTRAFRNLQTLRLGCRETTPKPPVVALLPSHIQDLSLDKIRLAFSKSKLYPGLLRLSLVDMTTPLSKLRDDLLAMPALEVLVLNDVRVQPQGDLPIGPIVLAHLRYLVVKKSKADLITPILDTPNLISLQLECPVGNSLSDPDTAEAAILPAIARRNTQLCRLHVVGCYMTPGAWTESFYNLPELGYLRVKGCDIEGAHLAALSGKGLEAGSVENKHGAQFSVCQRLEELVLENEMSIDSGTVRDIVEVRSALPESEGVKRVKWITFRGCDADLIKDGDVRAMAQLTKGIACDLLDGKEAWAEDLEESSAESGGDWSSSDGESGSTMEEDSDE